MKPKRATFESEVALCNAFLKAGDRYVAGPSMPSFKAQHPRVYKEISRDMKTWWAVK